MPEDLETILRSYIDALKSGSRDFSDEYADRLVTVGEFPHVKRAYRAARSYQDIVSLPKFRIRLLEIAENAGSFEQTIDHLLDLNIVTLYEGDVAFRAVIQGRIIRAPGTDLLKLRIVYTKARNYDDKDFLAEVEDELMKAHGDWGNMDILYMFAFKNKYKELVKKIKEYWSKSQLSFDELHGNYITAGVLGDNDYRIELRQRLLATTDCSVVQLERLYPNFEMYESKDILDALKGRIIALGGVVDRQQESVVEPTGWARVASFVSSLINKIPYIGR